MKLYYHWYNVYKYENVCKHKHTTIISKIKEEYENEINPYIIKIYKKI